MFNGMTQQLNYENLFIHDIKLYFNKTMKLQFIAKNKKSTIQINIILTFLVLVLNDAGSIEEKYKKT